MRFISSSIEVSGEDSIIREMEKKQALSHTYSQKIPEDPCPIFSRDFWMKLCSKNILARMLHGFILAWCWSSEVYKSFWKSDILRVCFLKVRRLSNACEEYISLDDFYLFHLFDILLAKYLRTMKKSDDLMSKTDAENGNMHRSDEEKWFEKCNSIYLCQKRRCTRNDDSQVKWEVCIFELIEKDDSEAISEIMEIGLDVFELRCSAVDNSDHSVRLGILDLKLFVSRELCIPLALFF